MDVELIIQHTTQCEQKVTVVIREEKKTKIICIGESTETQACLASPDDFVSAQVYCIVSVVASIDPLPLV